MLRPLLRPLLRPVVLTPALAILLGVGAFNPRVLFADPSTVGVHLETYDPNSILRRVNRLTYSSQFGNAAWTRGNILAVNEQADGVGDLVVPDTSNTQHYLRQVAHNAGVNSASVVRAKAGGYNILVVQYGTSYVKFDLSAGTVAASAGGVTGSIAAVDGLPGYYDCTVAGAPTNANFDLYVAAVAGTSTFAGDGVSGVYFARAQLEWNTTTPSAYQEVTDWNTEFLAAGGDRVTLFTDTSCKVPLTSVEQSIAAFITTERGTTRGPELRANGAAGMAGVAAAATYNAATGQGTAQRVDATNQSYIEFAGLSDNNGYEITLANTGANFIGVRTGSYGGAVPTTVNAGLTETFRIMPSGGKIIFTAGSGDIAFTVVSFKAIPGKVITQPTAGFQAKLKARVNKFTRTEDLSHADWNKGAGVTINAAATTAPDGSVIQTVTCATGTSVDFLREFVGGLSTPHKLVAWVKSISGNTTLSVDAENVESHSVVLTSQWQPLELTITPAAARSWVDFQLGGPGTYAIWHPDLRTAADAALNIPAYQRVNTSLDYETEGFPHLVTHDGSDDFYSRALDLSGTDKLTIWMAGKLKSSDAAAAILVEHTADASTTAGGFHVTAPSGAATATYSGKSRGTVDPGSAVANGYAAPRNDVVCISGDIAGDLTTIDVNGTQAGTLSGDQGTGNYANSTLYIGARAGTSLRSACAWSSLTIRGAATPDSIKRRMDRYSARLAKIVL